MSCVAQETGEDRVQGKVLKEQVEAIRTLQREENRRIIWMWNSYKSKLGMAAKMVEPQAFVSKVKSYTTHRKISKGGRGSQMLKENYRRKWLSTSWKVNFRYKGEDSVWYW